MISNEAIKAIREKAGFYEDNAYRHRLQEAAWQRGDNREGAAQSRQVAEHQEDLAKRLNAEADRLEGM